MVFFGWMNVDADKKIKSFSALLPSEPKCELDQGKFYFALDLREMAYNLIRTRENRGYFEGCVVEFGLHNGQRIEKFGDEDEDIGLWRWNKLRTSPRSELRFYLWTNQQADHNPLTNYSKPLQRDNEQQKKVSGRPQ